MICYRDKQTNIPLILVIQQVQKMGKRSNTTFKKYIYLNKGNRLYNNKID